MVNKQDSYWMECTLDEKVDQESHGGRFRDSQKILLCGCGAMITT